MCAGCTLARLDTARHLCRPNHWPALIAALPCSLSPPAAAQPCCGRRCAAGGRQHMFAGRSRPARAAARHCRRAGTRRAAAAGTRGGGGGGSSSSSGGGHAGGSGSGGPAARRAAAQRRRSARVSVGSGAGGAVGVCAARRPLLLHRAASLGQAGGHLSSGADRCCAAGWRAGGISYLRTSACFFCRSVAICRWCAQSQQPGCRSAAITPPPPTCFVCCLPSTPASPQPGQVAGA